MRRRGFSDWTHRQLLRVPEAWAKRWFKRTTAALLFTAILSAAVSVTSILIDRHASLVSALGSIAWVPVMLVNNVLVAVIMAHLVEHAQTTGTEIDALIEARAAEVVAQINAELRAHAEFATGVPLTPPPGPTIQ